MERTSGLDARYVVKPVIGALRVLEALALANRPLTVVEAAQRCSLSKTTVFRYLKTLAAMGYAEQTEAGFSIGPSIHLLSSDDARERAILSAAAGTIRGLCDATGETVNLAVPKGRRMHYLAILDGRTRRLRAQTGDSECLHSTALGKAVLAYLPEAEIDNHLNTPLPRFTARTITSRTRLSQALARVRRFGYALDDEENDAGIRCYGAALLGHGSRPIAAISISALAASIDAAADIELAERVVAAAADINARLAGARSSAAAAASLRSGRGRR
jgi:IclR family acetate operon transcriptional repressor